MRHFILLAFATIIGFASCSKDAVNPTTDVTTSEISTTTSTTTTTSEDAMVADLRGGGDGKAAGCTPVAITDIAQTAKDYITANYAGYTIHKASKRDSAGVVTYGVVIKNTTDNTPTVLIFDANWKFVKVAALPVGKDGKGGIGGGKDGKGNPPAGGKDGKGADNDIHTPLAVADIAQAAKDYAAANYAGYTVQGGMKKDSAGVVTYSVMLTKTGATPVVLIFDATWKFVKVAAIGKGGEGKGGDNKGGIGGKSANVTSIALTDIPQSAKDYAAANVAGYTVQGAVKEDRNGTITYTVFVTKTGTRPVALVFDANWVFVKRIG